MLFIWYTDIYHIFKNGQKLNAFIENNKMYNINVKHKKCKYFYFYIIGQNITDIPLVYLCSPKWTYRISHQSEISSLFQVINKILLFIIIYTKYIYLVLFIKAVRFKVIHNMIAMVPLQVKRLREFKTEKIQPCSFK